MDKAFSSIDLVGQCLLDKQRTTAFRKAIYKTVKPGMRVIDSGTGSGILAIFAAQAGSTEVLAIELDPYVASIARANFARNGLKNIKLIEDDARTMRIESGKAIDVILMEMLTTGMIDEFQVAAITNFKKSGNVSEKTIFIPQAQQSFITIGNGNFEFNGATMLMPLHIWDIHAKEPRFNRLAERKMYDNYVFGKDERTMIDSTIEFKALAPGTLNAILIESESILDNEQLLGETPALNGKVMIPIPDTKIITGETIRMRIRYAYGAGFESLKADIVQ